MDLYPAKISEVHGSALDIFELYSRKGVLPEEFQRGNFSGIWVANTDSRKIFIAKLGANPGNTGYEGCICVYLTDNSGYAIGYGVIGERVKPSFEVAQLYYLRSLQEGKGFGEEIAKILGEVSILFFKKPLNTGTNFTYGTDRKTGFMIKPALLLFEKLARERHVQRDKDGSFAFVGGSVSRIMENPLG